MYQIFPHNLLIVRNSMSIITGIILSPFKHNRPLSFGTMNDLFSVQKINIKMPSCHREDIQSKTSETPYITLAECIAVLSTEMNSSTIQECIPVGCVLPTY